MTFYRNGPPSAWDAIGAKRGVPSMASQAPTERTMGRQCYQKRRVPAGLEATKADLDVYTDQGRRGPTVASFQTGRQTMATNFSKVSRAPTRVGRYCPRAAFKPGVILRIPHHVPALPNSMIKANALTSTKFGDVCSKLRPFIIIACNEETYQAVALYTYGESGTDSVMCKDEYVSIQDHRSSQPFARLSKHEPLLTNNFIADVELYNPKSVCHMVGVFTFSYFTHVQIQGCLDSESTYRLGKLKYDFDTKVFEQALKAQSARRQARQS